jgi:RNA polymerase sigma factor (sigma-70 family)
MRNAAVERAFVEAYPRLSRAAGNVIRRHLWDQQEHGDAVDETLIRVFDKWERGEGNREAFTRGIALNVCRELNRKRPRHRDIEGLDVRNATRSGEDTVLDAITLEQALEGIGSERQRTVIERRFLDDLTEPQTARVLGLSLDQVKTAAKDGRRALKKAYARSARRPHGGEES